MASRDEQAVPQTLASQIVAILTQDLLFRRIEPGAILREAELCLRFGVSRPAIREAITRLELAGLVEIVPRKGIRAADCTPEELDDIITYHAVIFGCSCRLAAQRRTAAQLEGIRLAVTYLWRLASSGAEAEEYETARLCCYDAIERAAGTAFKVNRKRIFVTRMRHPYAIDSVATPEQRRASAKRWRKLYDLIAAGDGEKAEQQFVVMAEATRPLLLAACRGARAARARREALD